MPPTNALPLDVPVDALRGIPVETPIDFDAPSLLDASVDAPIPLDARVDAPIPLDARVDASTLLDASTGASTTAPMLLPPPEQVFTSFNEMMTSLR
jgi:hypothetical protein